MKWEMPVEDFIEGILFMIFFIMFIFGGSIIGALLGFA